MTKDQKIVVEWLSNTGQNFLWDIVELEGSYDGVPEEVCESYSKLSERQRIEAVKKAADNLLKKTPEGGKASE